MPELPFEYWNKLTSQFILTSVFLGGFSIVVTANLLTHESEKRLFNVIFRLATLSSVSFLIAVFGFTDIYIMTTESYPLEVTNSAINTARVIGLLGYLIGAFALIALIGVSGWTKSKRTGIFTTVIAAITLISFFIITVD